MDLGYGREPTCFGPALPVEGEVVQLVVWIDGIDISKVQQLFQSLIDEDDADERSESLLREAGYVADQRAGVGGHQHQAEEGRPQANTGPQGQIGQTVVTKDTQRGGSWKERFVTTEPPASPDECWT